MNYNVLCITKTTVYVWFVHTHMQVTSALVLRNNA